MAYTIPDLWHSRKVHDALLLLAITLLAGLAFGLGRLSHASPAAEVSLCNAKTEARVPTPVAQVGAASLSATPLPQVQGQYVGSKNGSVYHFPWCSGAKRIAEKNMVWFSTKEEAAAAGYRPASNCKGL